MKYHKAGVANAVLRLSVFRLKKKLKIKGPDRSDVSYKFYQYLETHPQLKKIKTQSTISDADLLNKLVRK